jgi:hypothetical protein
VSHNPYGLPSSASRKRSRLSPQSHVSGKLLKSIFGGAAAGRILYYRLEQAEIRRFHAMMLIDRAAQVIAKKRKRYLVGRRTYARIGMPRHSEMTETLLDLHD